MLNEKEAVAMATINRAYDSEAFTAHGLNPSRDYSTNVLYNSNYSPVHISSKLKVKQ